VWFTTCESAKAGLPVIDRQANGVVGRIVEVNARLGKTAKKFEV
jgi:hypothetical protein